MHDFSDILSPRAVHSGLVAQSKRLLFPQLAALAAGETGIDPAHLAERIAERERLGSTGFGGGIAIPHGKVDGLAHVAGLFARLAAPIEFGAIDGLPVDLVFLLLSPTEAGVAHLKTLARVSRALRDKAFVAKLRGAGSDAALYALLASGNERHAA